MGEQSVPLIEHHSGYRSVDFLEEQPQSILEAVNILTRYGFTLVTDEMSDELLPRVNRQPYTNGNLTLLLVRQLPGENVEAILVHPLPESKSPGERQFLFMDTRLNAGEDCVLMVYEKREETHEVVQEP